MLRGGSGDDDLDGGERSDTLIGGRGADRFHLSKGRDLIKDFKPEEGDRLLNPAGFDIRIQQVGDQLRLVTPDLVLRTTLHGISADQLLEVYPAWEGDP